MSSRAISPAIMRRVRGGGAAGRTRLSPDLPPTPLWFKVWFAICGLVGAGVLAVAIWAAIKLVNHFTNGG